MDRKKTSRKGDNGHVLIIGGSTEYVGALVLSGLASLRAGCDLVTVAAPEKVAWTANRYSPDIITHKLKASPYTVKAAKDLIKFADRFDAVLLGPGLTRRADKFSQFFIKKSMMPKVVDADALKSMSLKEFYNCIITPHETEMEMLLVNSGKDFLIPKLRAANTKEKAEILQGNLRYFLQNKNVLVLKGSTDIIISRNKIAFNRTGNQGMTKGGTGDVLAGLIAGFLAKSKEMFKSAAAGAYINGFVADQIVKKKKGYVFIASDLIDDMEKIARIERREKRAAARADPKTIKKAKKAPIKKALKKIVKRVSKKKVAKKKKPVKKKTPAKKPKKKIAKPKKATKRKKR